MRAELMETQIVTLTIHGLPPSMSSFFISIKLPPMDEFYKIARKAETNLRLRENARNRLPHPKSSGNQSKRKQPPNPCKICEERGHPGRMHWTYDCWLNPKNNSNLHKKFKPNEPHKTISTPKCLN